jgi:hypothetical protein
VGKGACAVPTTYHVISFVKGGHASLCPPYDPCSSQ